MSVEVMSWVLHFSPASGTEKVILLGIANHASIDGSNAWPSLATLATYARVDQRTVRRTLRALEEAGLIETEIKAGGTHDARPDQRPNRYRVVMKYPASHEGTHMSPRTPNEGTSTVERGDTGVPQNVLEPSHLKLDTDSRLLKPECECEMGWIWVDGKVTPCTICKRRLEAL